MDTVTYAKHRRYPANHGYYMPDGTPPVALVVHTTNNARPTAFATEAAFLYTSAKVSAHYLIGKRAADGVVQFLPDDYRAWHAGPARAPFGNDASIGVELHVSVGERPTDYQIDALTALVRTKMRALAIPARLIETHRAVALPTGRKTDPEGWPDAAFYAWRDALVPSSSIEAPGGGRHACDPDFAAAWDLWQHGYATGPQRTTGDGAIVVPCERAWLKREADGRIRPALLADVWEWSRF